MSFRYILYINVLKIFLYKHIGCIKHIISLLFIKLTYWDDITDLIEEIYFGWHRLHIFC